MPGPVAEFERKQRMSFDIFRFLQRQRQSLHAIWLPIAFLQRAGLIGGLARAALLRVCASAYRDPGSVSGKRKAKQQRKAKQPAKPVFHVFQHGVSPVFSILTVSLGFTGYKVFRKHISGTPFPFDLHPFSDVPGA